MKSPAIALCLAAGLLTSIPAAMPVAAADSLFVVAQAMIPPTGMGDRDKDMAAAERMRRRFPQPVRVADLVGLPVLDNESRTLGHVREVVRTKEGKIELIVSYDGWLGFGARLVAVPIEVVGIMGRELASLDMPPSAYAAAPTWQNENAQVIPDDAMIRIALARR